MSDLERLEELMMRHGAAIRAIPETVTGRFAPGHIDNPEFNRPEVIRKEIVTEESGQRWLHVTKRTKNPGQFLLETGRGTSSQVRFHGDECYESLADVLKKLEEIDRAMPVSGIRRKPKGSPCPK